MDSPLRPIVTLTAGILLALPLSAHAGDNGRGDIHVTDPALLESLGFAPDATRVYATEQALLDLAMDPAERAAEQARSAGELQPVFGTASVGYSPVGFAEFVPVNFQDDDGYSSTEDANDRYCVSGTPLYAATIQSMPHGGRLDSVSVWTYDAHATHDVVIQVRRICQPDEAPAAPTSTLLRQVTTAGSAGHHYMRLDGAGGNPLDQHIDLQSCTYVLYAALGTSSACTGGTDLRIVRARAEWRRQISPAPATASFGDVPTSHLFFRHIEALADSGITGGCGGGNFCPNQPLTRGQMAAFLATALGLHWESIP